MMEDYILVDSQKQHVEHYHREGNRWTWAIYRRGSTFELFGFGIQLALEDIYEKTHL